MNPSIGILEYQSIAKGLISVDVLVKKALVFISFAAPISSGKFVILFHGDEASVKESLDEGIRVVADTVVDHIYLPQIHEDIINALSEKNKIKKNAIQSVGILETTTIASCIEAADIALKASHVSLTELWLGQGIHGKGFFTLNGDLSDIEAAIEDAKDFATRKESLVSADVIANPHSDWQEFMLNKFPIGGIRI